MTLLQKQQIRRAFNAATNTYDKAADWQQNVGDILLSYLENSPPHHKTILDLGAGTGYMARHIQQQYPNNHLIALDIAESMLQFCRQGLDKKAQFICSDAENLALPHQSVDLIISNMVLHWCHSLIDTLKEQYRILTSGGLLFFSILGPQSLLSLKHAWGHIDQHSHINVFPEADTIQQSCLEAGFSLLRFERHEIQKYYQNVYELMYHLKATGAKNITTNKAKGLTGKQTLQRLSEQYKNPLHYEIFTGVCLK